MMDGESGFALRPGDFADDDYEEVNERYFRDILKERQWLALPAGWHNPYSIAAEQFGGTTLSARDHQRYALDEGSALGSVKVAIVCLASRWEGRDLTSSEVTICPSVSCANLALLCAMKRRGIERIVFETPAYFATADQARLLGFAVDKIPASRTDGFEAPIDAFVERAALSDRSAVWITQPRFGIGTNQPLERLRQLGLSLGSRHVLAIDEAGEQLQPSHTAALSGLPCSIVRTRGLTKGIGLNGLRISLILHPEEWRDDLERVLETAGASIDRYSLNCAAELAANPPLLTSMLSAANAQVCRSRATLERALLGSWATPTKLVNSYIGSILLDLRHLPGSYAAKREAILLECQQLRMPVVLRASIGFAFDPDWEAIRINYFTPEENVAETGRLLELVDAGVRLRLSRA